MDLDKFINADDKYWDLNNILSISIIYSNNWLDNGVKMVDT